MLYTFEDARAEVGKSKDWEVGRRASIKKWEQIKAGDEETYWRSSVCGMCFVCINQGMGQCMDCPAVFICHPVHNLDNADPQEVIDALGQLELPKRVNE